MDARHRRDGQVRRGECGSWQAGWDGTDVPSYQMFASASAPTHQERRCDALLHRHHHALVSAHGNGGGSELQAGRGGAAAVRRASRGGQRRRRAVVAGSAANGGARPHLDCLYRILHLEEPALRAAERVRKSVISPALSCCRLCCLTSRPRRARAGVAPRLPRCRAHLKVFTPRSYSERVRNIVTARWELRRWIAKSSRQGGSARAHWPCTHPPRCAAARRRRRSAAGALCPLLCLHPASRGCYRGSFQARQDSRISSPRNASGHVVRSKPHKTLEALLVAF